MPTINVNSYLYCNSNVSLETKSSLLSLRVCETMKTPLKRSLKRRPITLRLYSLQEEQRAIANNRRHLPQNIKHKNIINKEEDFRPTGYQTQIRRIRP